MTSPVVIDADCLIAGVLTSQGATSELLNRWQAGAFELVVCPRLVYEVRKALLSPRLADHYDISATDAESFAQQLLDEGLLVDDPVNPPRVVPDNTNDDYLIALALTSGCRFLVTRDRHFEKVDVAGLKVIGPLRAYQSCL